MQSTIATRKIGSRQAVTLDVHGEVSPSDALEVYAQDFRSRGIS